MNTNLTKSQTPRTDAKYNHIINTYSNAAQRFMSMTRFCRQLEQSVTHHKAMQEKFLYQLKEMTDQRNDLIMQLKKFQTPNNQ